jgi:ankyrin repeat protein
MTGVNSEFLDNRNKKLFSYFCKRGYIEHVIDIVNSKNKQIDLLCDRMCVLALMYDHLDVVKYLYYLPNSNVRFNKSIMFNLACKKGDVDFAKNLLNEKNNNIVINDHFNSAFHKACENDHVDMLKFLLSIPNNNMNINSNVSECCTCTNLSDVLYTTSRCGNLNTIKFLLSLSGNVSLDYGTITKTSCEFGHLHIIKFILDIIDDDEIKNFKENLFIIACNNTHDHIFFRHGVDNKTLYELRYTNIFIMACIGGYINVVKHIYEKYKDKIDINYENDISFYSSYHNNNTEVFEYILNIPNTGIDIRNNNDVLFKDSCDRNFIGIVNVLTKKCDKYIIKIHNDKIVYWYIKYIPTKTMVIMKNIEECPICLENISNVITDCCHQLCLDCCQHINKTKICHICRHDIIDFYLINT